MDEAARLRAGLAQESLVAQQAAFHQLSGQLPDEAAARLASSIGEAVRLFRGVFLNPSDHYERYLFWLIGIVRG